MNLKNILKIYALERQLNPDDIALLETLRGLNDTERESLVVALQPEKVTTKRASKKSPSKSASKSARASGMAAAIRDSLEKGRQVVTDSDNDDDNDKGMAGPLCQTCGNFKQYQDHFKSSPSYHAFDAGKLVAPPAGERSSTNGGADEDEQVSAASGD